MNRLLLSLLALVLLAACQRTTLVQANVSPAAPSAPGLSGGSSDVGSGSDNFRTQDGSAWFLGAERKIHYCVELAPDFGYVLDPAAAIDRAFGAWREYVERKGVLLELTPEFQFALQAVRVTPPGGHCPTPNELVSSEVDLVFYLGTRPKAIEPYFRPFAQPTAFAQRIDYKVAKRWGKGFIWMAKEGEIPAAGSEPATQNWKLHSELERLLVHELGHTLGIEHVTGTIMDKDIVALIHGRANGYVAEKVTIDARRELVFGNLGREDYVAPVLWHYLPETAKAGERLAGFPISRATRLTLRRDSPWHWDSLTIRDGARERVLSLENGEQRGFTSDSSIFRIALSDREFFRFKDIAYVLALHARETGDELLLEYNITQHPEDAPVAPVVLFLRADGKKIPLATFCANAMPENANCQ
jgi:hypothetical protein